MANSNPFVRGAASVLDLHGAPLKDDLDFTYNGKDVRMEESAEEVIQEALASMGALMGEFIAAFEVTQNENIEGHG